MNQYMDLMKMFAGSSITIQRNKIAQIVLIHKPIKPNQINVDILYYSSIRYNYI
jgi:hypothetical protein